MDALESELFEASREGDLQRVQELMTSDVNIDARNIDNWTPLMVAAMDDHAEIVETLIQAGADLRGCNVHGVTAYEYAHTANNEKTLATFHAITSPDTDEIYDTFGKPFGEGEYGPRWFCPFCGNWVSSYKHVFRNKGIESHDQNQRCKHFIWMDVGDDLMNTTIEERLEENSWDSCVAELIGLISEKQSTYADSLHSGHVLLSEGFDAAKALELDQADQYWFARVDSMVESEVKELVFEIRTQGDMHWSRRPLVVTQRYSDEFEDVWEYYTEDADLFVKGISSEAKSALEAINRAGAKTETTEPEIAFSTITKNDLEERLAQFTHVYRAAYIPPPWNETGFHVNHFREKLPEVINEKGFFGLMAIDTQVDFVVGFAIGQKLVAEDDVCDEIASHLTKEDRKKWLTDCFLIAEIAVLPDVRGRGIGTKLYKELVDNQPHETGLLTTLEEETRIVDFYKNHGWHALVELPDFYFSMDEDKPDRHALLMAKRFDGRRV